MGYRKLYLVNGLGNKFTFTEQESKQFLNSLSGLGFQKDLETYTIGSILKVSTSAYNFVQISGELMFYGETADAYEDYFNFINFVSFEPLQLYYLTPNTLVPFYCNVELIQADKSEYGKDKVLRVPLIMQPTSRWLLSEETVYELSNTLLGNGKHYDLQRDYYYPSYSLQNVPINNTGNNAVGFVIEIIGDVSNPQWTLSQNNSVYGSCKLTGDYDYIKVNSKDGEQDIYLEKDESAIANPTIYQDLSITGGVLTFPKIKPGKSIFTFISGNIDTFTGKVKVRFSNSYVSV